MEQASRHASLPMSMTRARRRSQQDPKTGNRTPSSFDGDRFSNASVPAKPRLRTVVWAEWPVAHFSLVCQQYSARSHPAASQTPTTSRHPYCRNFQTHTPHAGPKYAQPQRHPSGRSDSQAVNRNTKGKKRSANSRFCRCFSATYQPTPSTQPT